MTQAGYNTEYITATSGQVERVSQECEGNFRELLGQVEALRDSWTGPGATQMDDLFREFHGKAEVMLAELTRIGGIMRNAASMYDATEESVVRIFLT
jgi:WXG100 family type VII secretion target